MRKKKINHYTKGQKGDELKSYHLSSDDEKVIDELISRLKEIKKDEASKASSIGAKPRPIIGGVANHRSSGQTPLTILKQKKRNNSRKNKK